jgi:hypothetical protein
MQTTILIEGINPYAIAKVDVYKMLRFGLHPYWYTLHKKRFGWLAFRRPNHFDGVMWHSHVAIMSADGTTLKIVKCKSLADAWRVHGRIQSKLDSVLCYRGAQ